MSKGNVYANSRSVVHKGDGLTNICAIPDVCKTPSPGGPIPVPYVNLAMDRNLVKGTKKVVIAGNPIAIAKSKISTSSGDEPGTLGGVVSSKFKGKMAWASASHNVKAEGKGVIRFMDVTLHNGNSYNATWTQIGGVAVTANAYGDDTKCKICNRSRSSHRVHEAEEAADLCGRLIDKLTALVYAHDQQIDSEKTKVTQAQNELKDLEKGKRNQLARIENIKEQVISQEKTRLSQETGRDCSNLSEREFGQMSSQNTRDKMKRLKKMKREAEKNPPKKAAIDAKAEELKQHRDAVGYHGARKGYKEYGNGYMVGVLICKCCNKKYAASSGSAPSGFKDAAQSLGLTPVGKEVLGGGAGETYTCATSARLRSGSKRRQKKTRERMNRVYAEFHKNPLPHAPDRGNCAGPRLVLKCQQDGHAIGSISEKWFGPIQSDRDSVTQTRVEYHPTRGLNKPVQKTRITYRHRETVISCDTCKRELPPMLCDNDKAECNGGD